VVCVFLAFCFFNDVASYNPYAYSARFFPAINQDSYATMGDIDWSKRRDYFDEIGGMGDADWGWGWGQKKRSGYRSLEDEEEEESVPLEDEISSNLNLKRNPIAVYKSQLYKRPYALPRRPSRTAYSRTAYAPDKRSSRRYRPRYQPYRAYARYGAIPRPEGRQYSYASMADMDWGWKKRSQLPALMGTNESADDEPLTEDKRNLASLAKNNFFPREYKRSVDDEDANDSDIEEEKRHLGSFVRGQRAGLSSLARNGALRGKRQ